MNAEDVRIVRRALVARRSEFDELLDPSIRLDFRVRVFNPAVYEGYDGIMRWRAERGEVWESYVVETERFLVGEDAVVVLQHEVARGRGSGVETDMRTALVCRVRDSRLSHVRLYYDRAAALADAGLANAEAGRLD
jgi:hypothetical protein